MARTFYTDVETENAIKQIQERDIDFNLSAFVKEQLIKRSLNRSKDIDLNYLNYRKIILESEISYKENQLKYVNNQIEEVMKSQVDTDAITKTEKEYMEKKREARIKSYCISISSYFSIDDEKTILKLAEEFEEQKENFETLFDFLANRGYKEKLNEIIQPAINPKVVPTKIEIQGNLKDNAKLTRKDMEKILNDNCT